MNWQDLVNALFELLGGFVIWLSIIKLNKDKLVRGVDFRHLSFFALWGFWNVYYYFQLSQFLSWGAGLFITFSNTVYVLLIFKYMKEENENCHERIK